MTTDIKNLTGTSASAKSQHDHVLGSASKSAVHSVASPSSSPALPPPPPSASPPPPPRKPRRLLCLKEVSYRVGVARATVYRMVNRAREQENPSFPLPVQIAPGRIGWHEHELDAWIESLPRATDK